MDTARLARAEHLTARRVARGRYVATGGELPHVVTVAEGGAPVCDCTDFAMHGGPCKYIVACRLRRGDLETLEAPRDLVPMPKRMGRRAERSASAEGAAG